MKLSDYFKKEKSEVTHVDTHGQTDDFFDCLVKLGFNPLHIVDVGANRGNWTRTARKYFGESYYTLFDPQEEMRAALDDLTQDPKVQFHCMGAGPVNSSMKLTEHNRDDSFTFALSDSEATTLGRKQRDVPVVKLDDFLPTLGLPTPEIIKIDAEGWDLEVIKGAERTAQNAEIILMEASVMNKIFKNNVHDVILEMEPRGFTLFDITEQIRTAKHNGLWLVELAFVKKGGNLDSKINSYA